MTPSHGMSIKHCVLTIWSIGRKSIYLKDNTATSTASEVPNKYLKMPRKKLKSIKYPEYIAYGTVSQRI